MVLGIKEAAQWTVDVLSGIVKLWGASEVVIHGFSCFLSYGGAWPAEAAEVWLHRRSRSVMDVRIGKPLFRTRH